MHIVPGREPHLLHVRLKHKGRWLEVLHLASAILLLGIFLYVEELRSLGWGWKLGFAAAWVLAVAGTVVRFVAQPGYTLDARARIVRTWRRQLMKPAGRPIDASDKIVVRWDKGLLAGRAFRIFLEGRGPGLRLGTFASHEEALESAETLAAFLGLSVADIVRVQMASRNPERPWKYIQQIVSDKKTDAPSPPKGARTTCSLDEDGLVLDFPMAGFHPLDIVLVIGGVLGLPLAVAFIVGLWPGLDHVPLFVYLLAPFFLSPLLGGWVLVRAVRRIRLKVSPDVLEWRSLGIFCCALNRTPTAAIDEIVLPAASECPTQLKVFLFGFAIRPWKSSPGIMIRAGKKRVEFGRGLPFEELRWAYSVIAMLAEK